MWWRLFATGSPYGMAMANATTVCDGITWSAPKKPPTAAATLSSDVVRPRQPASAAEASCHRSACAGLDTATASRASRPLVLASSPTSAAAGTVGKTNQVQHDH